MPRQCLRVLRRSAARSLYDNGKVVTLGRDQEDRSEWNRRMLDCSFGVGFEMRLCRPYRAQIKGKVERGVKYVRRNLWPSVRFTGDADLNRQALEWCDGVANRWVHGTTGQRPWELLERERAHLGPLPERSGLSPICERAGRWGGMGTSIFKGPGIGFAGPGRESQFKFHSPGSLCRESPPRRPPVALAAQVPPSARERSSGYSQGPGPCGNLAQIPPYRRSLDEFGHEYSNLP